MSKIIRTPIRAEGGITSEEKAKMDLIAQKWIKNAFQTGDVDKGKLTDAIYRLYATAGLKKPRVVIVPSPLVMTLAYGISSVVWYLRKNKKSSIVATDAATRYATDDATDAATRDATADATYAATDAATRAATRAATADATRAATDAATYAATYAATRDATADATRAATRAATYAATYDATRAATAAATDAATADATYAATDDATRDATAAATDAATDAATRDATRDATYAATDAATDAATRAATDAATRAATTAATTDATTDATMSSCTWLYKLILSFVGKENVKFAIECCKNWYPSYQGGNMWSGFPSYAETMRDVIRLVGLNCWEKYQVWEDCAKLGGFRVIHKEFCLVCEFPKEIHLKENQLHNEKGAAMLWKDGFAIYSLNGVRVPEWLIKTPAEQLDPELLVKEQNAEVRREIIRKIGMNRILQKLNATKLDTYREYELYNIDNIDIEPVRILKMVCPSKGLLYALRTPPDVHTAREAIKWVNNGVEPEQFLVEA